MKINETINEVAIMAYAWQQATANQVVGWQQSASRKLGGFLTDERGDTNFISVIVMLGIALLVATVFILFKNQIIAQAQAVIGSFDIDLGGGGGGGDWNPDTGAGGGFID